MQETQVQFLGQEDPPGKEMAAHSSVLVQRILWTEEPGLVDYSPWSHKRVRQGLGTKQQKTLLSTLCTFSMFKSHRDLLHLLLLWILILQMQKLRHRIFK